jgi:Kef-type K+ transport system membrane component KefB
MVLRCRAALAHEIERRLEPLTNLLPLFFVYSGLN